MVITSPAAVIAYGEQVAKETKEAYSHRNPHPQSWLEYDLLKEQLEQIDNIEDKLIYLTQIKYYNCKDYLNDTKSFENAIEAIRQELKFKQEKEYYEKVYRRSTGLQIY